VDVDVDVARAHAHAGRARAYKLINKTTAFYWNVKAEYWYSSRGLPKICMPASCMLMTDAGTHGERVSASPLASGCQRVVVRSLAPWRLIATWKAHLSILTLALSTRSDHISTPPHPLCPAWKSRSGQEIAPSARSTRILPHARLSAKFWRYRWHSWIVRWFIRASLPRRLLTT